MSNEVSDRDYDRWAQEVHNEVLRQSLPFPYIFAHMDDLGYRDGSSGFFSGGARSSGYSSGTSHHSSSVGYSNNATRAASNTAHRGSDQVGHSSSSVSSYRNTSHNDYGSRAYQTANEPRRGDMRYGSGKRDTGAGSHQNANYYREDSRRSAGGSGRQDGRYPTSRHNDVQRGDASGRSSQRSYYSGR